MAKILNCYFPHDYDARNDRKILKLRRIHGWQGYGLYFALLEILRGQDDFRYPLDNISELEFELRESKEIILSVIRNFDLFKIDEANYFYSISLIARLQPYLEKSERARDAVNKRWEIARKTKETNTNVDTFVDTFVDTNASTNRIEENRIEENRIEKTAPAKKQPDFITKILFDVFWVAYDKKVGSKEKLEKKWNKFSLETQKKILDHVELYKKSQPNKQYRKNPETYFNNQGWTDEIIEFYDPLDPPKAEFYDPVP
uniref:Lin1244/Lin1753-like N-terminal domain-containing protein n=1 Tax=viral metagenome TaxID=1070528 RepID=A0A6M3KXC5_9ZZZZ